MKNLIFLFLSSALLTIQARAQTLQDAVRKTMNERYEAAETDLKQLIATSPTAETYFYAGDNYYYWGEPEQARSMFEQAISAAPTNPLGYVGAGRMALTAGDDAKADVQFAKAVEVMNTKQNKVDKNIQQLAYMKMAEALVQVDKKLDVAMGYLTTAQKMNETNPEVFVQWGDYYAQKDAVNLSNALAQYEKALQIDPKYTRSLLREGQLYVKVRNWDTALAYFDKAIAADPNFAPAYREKAELLYAAGRFNPAIESYAKYLELNNNCRVQQRYASFIFLTKNYKKAIEEVEKAKPCDPSNPIMYRVLGYSYFETGEFAKALENMNFFFDMAEKRGKPVPAGADYAYLGKSLWKTGQDSLGIEKLLTAVEKDTSYKDGYSDIAAIYYKMKRYDKAGEYYQKKVDSQRESSPLDNYYLGQARYFNKEYALSDAAFEKASVKYPDAHFWRGRCNSRMDNQEKPTGMAKPHFDMFLTKVGQDAKSIETNRKNLIETYSYLGFYYYSLGDFDCSKAAWNKVVELDAVNEKAKVALTDKDIAVAPGTCVLIPVTNQ
jgi:tetratricopeptide (TPR) repeat protein